MNAVPLNTGKAKLIARRLLRRFGLDVIRLTDARYDDTVPLPADAKAYLRGDNPRLLELQQTYAALGWPVCGPSYFWNRSHIARDLDLTWFRGDNAYVWQHRQYGHDSGRLKRYIALGDIEQRDARGLLSKLGEDGLFGCWTERYGKRGPVSRDLLDSVNEINFLERHLGLFERKSVRVLDIGAGYGRLAYRMSQALPNLERYDCIDAVPESTFLCEYYLRHRGISPRARAVPLHEIGTALVPGNYDLAVNIHSFSECTYAAIAWWMERVKVLRIPWLLIVPNEPEKLLSTEPDFVNRDFLPLVEAAGYRLAVKTPVHENPEVRELVDVKDHFFLFKLEA